MSINCSLVPLLIGNASTIAIEPNNYTASLTTRFYRLSVACLLILTVSSLTYVTYNVCFHPLRHIPGPTLAAMTPFWQIYHFFAGNTHEVHMQLHQKYGAIVRTTPNTVLVNDPVHFQEIFNWDKGNWWIPFRGDPVHIGHVSAMEMKDHMRRKNRVRGAYHQSRILKNENMMDKYISTFMEQLSRREKQVVDFVSWTSFLIGDIGFEIMISHAFNFTAAGRDVDGVLKNIKSLLTLLPLMGFLSTLSKIILSGLYMKWIVPVTMGKVHRVALQEIFARYDSIGKPSHGNIDVLQWIVDRGVREPSMAIDPKTLMGESVTPILASADSTGCVAQATVLYLSTHPTVFTRLREEIDGADAKGLLSFPIVRFNEVCQHIPFLELVIKETMRIYPPTGIGLPRAVPVGGATVCGYYLPRGTDVGISHWAVGHNKAIFGEDASIYNPGRWEFLEDVPGQASKPKTGVCSLQKSDTAESQIADTALKSGFESRKRLMEASFISFSSGPMQCTGRLIALTALYKTIAQLYRQFDVKMVNPARPFKVKNRMVMMHSEQFLVMEERQSWKARTAA